MVRIQIESSWPIDQTAEIGSKKSIKRRFKSDLNPIWIRFESDLKQNLAGGRLDCISLPLWEPNGTSNWESSESSIEQKSSNDHDESNGLDVVIVDGQFDATYRHLFILD